MMVFCECILETIPQFILQIYNSVQMDRFPVVTIISIVISSLILFSLVWKYFWFLCIDRFCRNNGQRKTCYTQILAVHQSFVDSVAPSADAKSLQKVIALEVQSGNTKTEWDFTVIQDCMDKMDNNVLQAIAALCLLMGLVTAVIYGYVMFDDTMDMYHAIVAMPPSGSIFERCVECRIPYINQAIGIAVEIFIECILCSWALRKDKCHFGTVCYAVWKYFQIYRWYIGEVVGLYDIIPAIGLRSKWAHYQCLVYVAYHSPNLKIIFASVGSAVLSLFENNKEQKQNNNNNNTNDDCNCGTIVAWVFSTVIVYAIVAPAQFCIVLGSYTHWVVGFFSIFGFGCYYQYIICNILG
eukprot:128354_1